MDGLRTHYEEELRLLRERAGEFARRYPKIASRLQMSAEAGEDPHVERLVQSFAFLSARIHKRLDDDFPLFTERFLEVLYPHYLRPFPACSIAQFDLGPQAAQMTQPAHLPRGTVLHSRPVRGVTCRFRTAFDLHLAPVRVLGVRYRSAVQVPEGTPVARAATGMLSLRLECTAAQLNWAEIAAHPLRLHLAGEASQVNPLREALLGHVVQPLVQTQAAGPWALAPGLLPRAVGFAEDEGLIDYDARSPLAYRLLTEYFAFPEKFHFVDLPLPAAVLQGAGREITLHWLTQGLNQDAERVRSLESLGPQHVLTGCTPIVNLLTQRAEPILLSQTEVQYPVLPDARRPFGYEVYSIDRVFRVQQTPQGEEVQPFRAFYALDHAQLLAEGEDAGRYWVAHRDDSLAERSPGFETELSIVDIDFNPAAPQTDTLSIDVTATNRDLPQLLGSGNPGGDLFMDGGSVAREIRLLRRPTETLRLNRGQGSLWRLISHLSLNHLSLSERGIEALKEMLRLYDLPRSATNRQLVDGLVGVSVTPASACLPGQPFATFVRGAAIVLTVDESQYAGTSLRLLAELLDHFFALYAQANSFTQLEVRAQRSGQPLHRFARRSGEGPLL